MTLLGLNCGAFRRIPALQPPGFGGIQQRDKSLAGRESPLACKQWTPQNRGEMALRQRDSFICLPLRPREFDGTTAMQSLYKGYTPCFPLVVVVCGK